MEENKMNNLKRSVLYALLISAFVSLAVSCGGSGTASGKGGAVAAAEAQMMEEMQAGLPDFSSPTMTDPNVRVEGMPEEVVWLTSYPKDLSSKYTKTGGTYRYQITEYPTTFRTMGPESNLSTRSLFLTMAPFIDQNPETYEPMPYAATHWAFGADNQTVYYKLHEGMLWSDGEKCTADDWVFSYEMRISPNLEDPFYNKYWNDYDVKKINDYCVAVKYLPHNKMTKSLLLEYTNFSPRPKHFYGGKIDKGWYNEYNWKAEPTTGAYYFKEEDSVKGELLVFERVENWWARSYPYYSKRANFGRLEYKVITGGTAIMQNYLLNGELDILPVNIPDLWRSFAAKEPVTNGYIDRWVVNFLPLQGVWGIFLNTTFPLFSKKEVRQAMYYAMDIQGMIDQALYGEYKRYHNIGIGHIWEGIEFDDDTIRKPDFDPDKARELLGIAGYTVTGSDGILQNAKGERVSFELLYAAPNHTERLSILKEQAKKAGVEMELKLMESGAFNTILNKKHQAYWGALSTLALPEYNQLFSKENAEKVSTNNSFGWWSPEMEALLAIEQSFPPIKEAAENSKKIQRLAHEEALIIPNYYLDFERYGAWKWLRFPWWGNRRLNVKEDSIESITYSNAWIDEDIKDEVLAAMKDGKTFEPRVWEPSKRYIKE